MKQVKIEDFSLNILSCLVLFFQSIFLVFLKPSHCLIHLINYIDAGILIFLLNCLLLKHPVTNKIKW